MVKKYTLHELMDINDAQERYGVTLDQLQNRLKPSKVGAEKLEQWKEDGLLKMIGKQAWLITPAWMDLHFKK